MQRTPRVQPHAPSARLSLAVHPADQPWIAPQEFSWWKAFLLFEKFFAVLVVRLITSPTTQAMATSLLFGVTALLGLICRPYDGEDYVVGFGSLTLLDVQGFISEEDADDILSHLQMFFTSVVAAGVAFDHVSEGTALFILMPLTIFTTMNVLLKQDWKELYNARRDQIRQLNCVASMKLAVDDELKDCGLKERCLVVRCACTGESECLA